MGQRVEDNHVISGANVAKYVDETTDGGYWYTIKGKEPSFVAITDKALELFGFRNLEELVASGATPHSLVHPISSSARDEKAYWDFVEGKTDRFYMDCSFTSTTGKEYYGELFIAHSLVFPHEPDEGLYRVMLHIFSPTDALFRQSKQLLDEMNSGVLILQEIEQNDYALRYGNEGFCNVFKWEKSQLKDKYGVNIAQYIYEEDYDSVIQTLNTATKTGENQKNTYRLLDSEGNPIWVKAEHKNVTIGSRKMVYINFINITDLMDIQKEMQRANNRLSSFLNRTPAGITVFEKKTDQYSISAINNTLIAKINEIRQRTSSDAGNVSKDQFVGQPIDYMLKFVDPLDHCVINQLVGQVEKEKLAECNFKMYLGEKNTKESVWVHCKAIARRRTSGNMQIIAVYDDITKQVAAEEEIKNKQAKIINMSYHDALTDVLNRQSYNEFFKKRGRSSFKNTGVAFVDLNGLKVINDTYGHSKGDDAIKLTVMLMEHYFDKDEIYRLSGDNFVIIKEDINQESFYGKMGKLIGEFNKYEIAAVGYNWDDSVTDLAHNIDKAEAAMRVAKQDYYVKHQEDVSKHRPAELNELLNDIKNGRYVMYLQPKAYTNSTKVVAAESLIRRVEIDGSITAPNSFVPLLEKQRLVPYIDFFILEETCKTLEKWDGLGRNKIKISVNMSRVTLAEPDYINRVLEVTDKYKIDRSQIEFEITESQETMDRHTLEDVVCELANLGFGVSLDDMGTEYSSVMMLTMKGIDTVKIDRGFVIQMNTEKGKIIVDHLIKMCHDLGEICIAEGVEDDETRLLLEKMGCDMYQGYLLAKPIPIEEFEAMMSCG